MPLIIRALITSGLLTGMSLLINLLATTDIPDANQDQVWLLTGIIGTLTTQSVMWWFGSSKGSSDKTEILKGPTNA